MDLKSAQASTFIRNRHFFKLILVILLFVTVFYYFWPNELLECDKDITPDCQSFSPVGRYELRGNYWVLLNYFVAEKSPVCNNSITYTTHADFTFLDNLIPLLERWQGPVSISVYAPGEDFKRAVNRILYLRKCSGSTLVKDFVTFHIFFDTDQMPKEVPRVITGFECLKNSKSLELKDTVSIMSYRVSHNLTYPVNMARMIARDMARTFFVLASDIELYPSHDIIPNFMKMIQRDLHSQSSTSKRVYVLPIFEADINVKTLPQNKFELLRMMKNESVIPFHKFMCPLCHSIPRAKEWIATPIRNGEHVFHSGKRVGHYKNWEPIFIGTKNEPQYDTRLHWDGKADKMTQAYIMCILEYDFTILENAFLVHRPGIKKITPMSAFRTEAVLNQTSLIRSKIKNEIELLYGSSRECTL